MKKIPLIFFCLLAYIYSQEIALERFTTKDGLSQNSITSIVQDSIGFLWLGTYDGLNRYDGYEYKVYRHNPRDPNSINHNHIRALCVDYKGNLWIGTVGGGLNFYDYTNDVFKSYQFNLEDKTSLSFNSITTLIIDSKQNLWIGTASEGINKFSLSDFYNTNNIDKQIHFERLLNSDVNTSNTSWNRITTLYQDKNDNIWIGTRNGLSKFDPSTQLITHIFSDPNDPNGLKNDVSAISEDKFGNLWIGNWENSITKYIPEENRFISYPFKENDSSNPSYNMIMCIYKDHHSDLWIGTWGGGLNKLNITGDKENSKVTFTHFKANSKDLFSIHNLSVYSIFEDKSGILWVGSDWNGLYKNVDVNNKFKQYYSNIKQPDSRNQNTIFDIMKDRLSDNLWLATRHNGISIFNLKTQQSKYYMHNPNIPSSITHNKIRDLFTDRSGRMWIGTEIGLDRFDYKTKSFIHYILDQQNPYSINIFNIQDDQYGNIWVGTYATGLFKMNTITGNISHYLYDPNNPNSIGDNMIWKIHEDKKGNLWVGTDKGGLNLYDSEKDHFIRHLHNPENPKSISSNKILTIFEQNSGQLWFGTTVGLNQLETKEDYKGTLRFKHYSTEEGLPTNTIHGILEDNHGNLWISTNNGLSHFAPDEEKFMNYTESDGLQDQEFSVNACYKDTITGKLYFGGINGFNVFHPDSIKFNKILPEIVFTDFKVFNNSISVKSSLNDRIVLNHSLVTTDTIVLSHDDQMFSIAFSGLHYNSPENNQYAYMLEEFEKNWNLVDATHRVATYTNLDPGTFIFKVKASNNDGFWNNDVKTLTIIISPAWWQTWWFKFILLLTIALILVSLYLMRINQVNTINKSLEIKVKERTAQLEASNKELEAFAYSVSHDLRTPLRGINGFSRVIEEDFEKELSNDLKKYFQKIKNASTRMGHLIDSMLKLSRIIRVELKKDQVNLSKMASEIVEELKFSHSDQKIDIKIQPNMFAVVDADLMRIVLENLLSNAFKFTKFKPEAKIEFGCEYKQGKNLYYISDNGVGFDQEFVKNLFIPFSRLHSENEFDGIGIGLASCKKIVEKHNGSIWAESNENQGATFYFVLNHI